MPKGAPSSTRSLFQRGFPLALWGPHSGSASQEVSRFPSLYIYVHFQETATPRVAISGAYRPGFPEPPEGVRETRQAWTVRSPRHWAWPQWLVDSEFGKENSNRKKGGK